MYDVERGKPPYDSNAGPRSSAASLIPVLVVLGFGIVMVVGLVAFTGLAGLYIILALAGVLGFAAMHYVLWGWWLSNKLRSQEPDEPDRDG